MTDERDESDERQGFEERSGSEERDETVDRGGADETGAPVDASADSSREAEAAREAAGETTKSETRAAPMGPLADRVAGWRERRRVPDDGDESGGRAGPSGSTRSAESLFESETVERIDSEALWEQLAADDEFGPSAGSRTVREVATRQYCQQCEHFSAPPAVECANEGTEILDVPTLSTVRVANCPVIGEEEALDGGR